VDTPMRIRVRPRENRGPRLHQKIIRTLTVLGSRFSVLFTVRGSVPCSPDPCFLLIPDFVTVIAAREARTERTANREPRTETVRTAAASPRQRRVSAAAGWPAPARRGRRN
jgi:hypothetical protein